MKGGKEKEPFLHLVNKTVSIEFFLFRKLSLQFKSEAPCLPLRVINPWYLQQISSKLIFS